MWQGQQGEPHTSMAMFSMWLQCPIARQQCRSADQLVQYGHKTVCITPGHGRDSKVTYMPFMVLPSFWPQCQTARFKCLQAVQTVLVNMAMPTAWITAGYGKDIRETHTPSMRLQCLPDRVQYPIIWLHCQLDSHTGIGIRNHGSAIRCGTSNTPRPTLQQTKACRTKQTV